MSKHNHNQDRCCHATIKYCTHCDVAYCVNCNKEWGALVTVYTNPQTNPYIYPNAGITMVDAGITMGSVTVYNSDEDAHDSIVSVLEKTMRHAHQ
jgi:hypothetical protein